MSRRVRIKVSLFAFQDIITSVTGVIVLVTLLSSLELVHRKAEPVPSSQAATDVSRLADQIPALELAVASGKLTKAEILGFNDFAIKRIGPSM